MFAIIAAGGSGSRMGQIGAPNKIFLPLRQNITVLQCTIDSILSANVCRGICVVARLADIPTVNKIISSVPSDLEVVVVEGGVTRADSVKNGLNAIRGKAQYVLIHDAARPLCPPELIRAVTERARVKQAAILATPVRSTLKRSEDGEAVLRTVPREGMWEAQTPQAFLYSLLDEAYAAAGERRAEATDDSQIVENFGHSVDIVPSTPLNFKITTTEDFAMAKQYTERRIIFGNQY